MNKIGKYFGVSAKAVFYAVILLFFLASLTVTVLSVDFFVEYSSLPIGLTKATIGILLLALIDDVIFSKINTIDAIQHNNISYAIIYFANAIIIAACISFA
jgi:hypothetical protein